MLSFKFVPLFFVAILLLACENNPPEYKPAEGEPDLRLFTGHWKGYYTSGSFSDSISYKNELEMMGTKAGERDMLSMITLDDEGNPKEGSYPDRIYVTPNEVSYLSESYKTESFIKNDSVNFEWNLVQEQPFREDGRLYRDHVEFYREGDSLFTSIIRVYEDNEDTGEENKKVLYQTNLVKQ